MRCEKDKRNRGFAGMQCRSINLLGLLSTAVYNDSVKLLGISIPSHDYLFISILCMKLICEEIYFMLQAVKGNSMFFQYQINPSQYCDHCGNISVLSYPSACGASRNDLGQVNFGCFALVCSSGVMIRG